MKFKAAVTVIPSDEVKPKNGKEILKQLKKFKVDNVTDVIVGRFFSVEVNANSKNAAAALIEEISEMLIDKEQEKASFVIEEL